MKRFALMLILVIPGQGASLLAQDGRVQLSTHIGTNADWSTLLGGQAGLRVSPRLTVTATGTGVQGLSTGTQITYWDVSLRGLVHRGSIRPYLLAGATRKRGRVQGQPDYIKKGVVLGAGAEVGRGLLRGFAEARVARTGALFSGDNGVTDAWFWVGVRLHLGR